MDNGRSKGSPVIFVNNLLLDYKSIEKEVFTVKNQELINKMTLEEKAVFLSGRSEWETWEISRLGIPSIFCSDGPHGIRKQAGAGAMLDIITGKINPSGRLSETYSVRYEDTPVFRYFPSTQRNSEYRESIYVGWKIYRDRLN